jgi:hypothetical protein
LRNRSGELLDGALTSLDCRCGARHSDRRTAGGGSILSSAASNDALRDQLLRLVMHCGFTASFVPVARRLAPRLDAAQRRTVLDVCANGAWRARIGALIARGALTWTTGFVVVRRVAPTHKAAL